MLEVKRKPASPSHGGTATATARAYSVSGGSTASAGRDPLDFNGKLPAITGECHFKGSMSIDGFISGQVGGKSATHVKQKPSGKFAVQAELFGEFTFKDMIRVNGQGS